MSANPNEVQGAGAGIPPPAAPPATDGAGAGSGENARASDGTFDLGAAAQAALDRASAPASEPETPTLVATPEPGAEIPPAGLETSPEVAQPEPKAEQRVQADFAALRGERDNLKTQLDTINGKFAEAQTQLGQFEAVKPVVEILQRPGVTKLVSMLSPALDTPLTGWDDPRATEVGVQMLKEAGKYDLGFTRALINGTLELYKDDIRAKALGELGLDEAGVKDYQAYLQSNGVAPPSYSLGKFPEPVKNGTTLTPMDDGTFVPLDLTLDEDTGQANNPSDVRAYNLAKRDFERTLQDRTRDEQAKTEKAQRETEAKNRLAQEADLKRRTQVSTWAQQRGQAETDAYNKAGAAFTDPKFNGEFAWLEGAVSSYAHQLMRQDKEYGRYLQDGQNAAANGEGRAAEIGEFLDTRGKQHIATAVTEFNKLINRLVAAEANAGTGQPQIPKDAPKITKDTVRQITEPANGRVKESPVSTIDTTGDYADMARAAMPANWAAQFDRGR